MDFSNMSGAFGSNNDNNDNNYNDYYREDYSQRSLNDESIFSRMRYIAPIRWVDIICGSLIAIALLLIIFNWNSVMTALFTEIMFPFIVFVSELLVVALIIAVIVGFIYFKLFRWRRWY